MKGFIKRTAAAVGLGAAIFTTLGCSHYRDTVDPCWLERYSFMARGSVRDMTNAQADKGHKLDTTVWATYFEKDPKTTDGTAKLNEAGKLFLRDIARRQPFPDPQLWLEYPYDVKDATKRNDMIADRKAAIRTFMATETKLASANFQIDVHDFLQPSYPASWTNRAYNQIRIQGALQGGGGGAAGGVGGTGNPNSGGGGGGGGSGGGGATGPNMSGFQ